MRSDQDGLIAVVRIPSSDPGVVQQASFILVAEGVEKPGNLGALLRTADGAGVDAIVLVDSPIDIYGPHTIRTSLGAVFKIPVLHFSADSIVEVLRNRKATIVAADPYAKPAYFDSDLTAETLAVVLGSEANGLSATWHQHAALVKIPMSGICDSLNVSVSGALLMYEAVRQRRG
jgi:TrmH family RNA methyltransferase